MNEAEYVKKYFRKENSIANWWDPTEGDLKHIYLKEIEIIKKYLFKDKKIKTKAGLELSIGKGRLGLNIYSLFQKYLGTDISNQMLKITKKQDNKIKLKKIDSENLSTINNETYDYVFCLAALVHYPNPDLAINEISRVLKKGGISIISVDNNISIKRLFKSWVTKKNLKINSKFKPQGNSIFQVYSKKELKNMFKQNNLKIEKIIYLGMIPAIQYQTSNYKNKYLISPEVSYKLRRISFLIDKIPIINRVANYQIFILKK